MNLPLVPPRVPEAIGAMIARLPQLPHSFLLATALNLGLTARLDAEVVARLRNKAIRIVVGDAGIAFTLCFDGRVFRPRSARGQADVTIAADAYDFGLLALRKEDPDTLFFARRLTMQGDTELGLLVKNMLDRLDRTALTDTLQRPAMLLSKLLERLAF